MTNQGGFPLTRILQLIALVYTSVMAINGLTCLSEVKFLCHVHIAFAVINVDLGEYLDAAELLTGQFGLSRDILLATDDPNLIKNLKSDKASRRGFTFYYSDFSRQEDSSSAVDFAAKNDARLEVIIATIAELMLCSHPNIGGYVFTTKSNIGRIINELRKTDGKRSNYPYIDLHYGEYR